MKARSQSEHEKLNAKEYPGTRQLCTVCDAPTGHCEEDSLYFEGHEDAPLCEECYERIKEIISNEIAGEAHEAGEAAENE